VSRLRVGVVGLGAIAQIQHLPNLEQLSDRYELAHVCDLSPRLAETIAERYGVAARSTDWRELCSDASLDAVILLNSGSHGPQARAALEHGLHVLAEKPLCFTVREADELEDLARSSERVLQVGYMKSHEAVMARARTEVERLGDLRFVRHAVFHPSEVQQQEHIHVLRFDDADPEALRQAAEENAALVLEAIGDVAPGLQWLYSELGLGSIVHYLAVFRSLFGRLPESIIAAYAWPFDPESPPLGWGPDDQLPTLSVFASFGGECRLDLTWAWLQRYPEYRELIEVFSPEGGVRMQLPPPYLHHRTAALTVERLGADGGHESVGASGAFDAAFLRELRDFHAAVTEGVPVVSTAADARDDVRFCQELVARVAESLAADVERVS
jgi:predicted dehydrogenase